MASILYENYTSIYKLNMFVSETDMFLVCCFVFIFKNLITIKTISDGISLHEFLSDDILDKISL